MECKKCGNKLRRNEEFCTYCGFYNGKSVDAGIKNDDEYDLIKFEENAKLPNYNGNSDDKKYYSHEIETYLEAYIGEDYKTVRKKIFNIFAFLLNWIYFLYRKLYITGIIGLIITYVVAVWYLKYFPWYILGCSVLFGFLFNPYYIFIVKSKIHRLKDKNSEMDSFNFANVCAGAGGVSPIIALLLFIIFLLAVFFNYVTINVNDYNPNFREENMDNEATCSSALKVAYQDILENLDYKTLLEGSCRISKNPKKVYDVYLKMTKDNRTFYVYYYGEDGSIEYKLDTYNQNDLELKKANYIITDEESALLKKYQDIVNLNYDIRNKEKEEKRLVEEKKNTQERVNYVFSKEEIDR